MRLKYFRNLALALSLTFLGMDYTVPQIKSSQRALTNINYGEDNSNPIPEEEYKRVILSFQRNNCFYLEEVIETLRFSIKEATIREISDIIAKNPIGTSEKGGQAFLNFDRLRFYEGRNDLDELIDTNTKIISCLHDAQTYTDISTCLGLAPEVMIATISSDVNSRFSFSSCAIESSDEGWKTKVGNIKAGLAITREDIRPETVIRMLESYNDALKMMYSPGKLYSERQIGGRLGNVHTHDNATEFSNRDRCLSRTYDEVYILISHNFPNNQKFKLYLMYAEDIKLLGNYGLSFPQCKTKD